MSRYHSDFAQEISLVTWLTKNPGTSLSNLIKSIYFFIISFYSPYFSYMQCVVVRSEMYNFRMWRRSDVGCEIASVSDYTMVDALTPTFNRGTQWTSLSSGSNETLSPSQCVCKPEHFGRLIQFYMSITIWKFFLVCYILRNIHSFLSTKTASSLLSSSFPTYPQHSRISIDAHFWLFLIFTQRGIVDKLGPN